jgi:hypothetical protein
MADRCGSYTEMYLFFVVSKIGVESGTLYKMVNILG